jgi:hypothetical protein
MLEHTFHKSGTDETGCPGYEDRVIRPNDESVAFHLAYMAIIR